jgi:hypothetical protein
MACWIRVVTKTTVSPRMGLNIIDVAAVLANPLCAFWKNNVAIALTIISARNLFFDGCYIWSVYLLALILELASRKSAQVKLSSFNRSPTNGPMSS